MCRKTHPRMLFFVLFLCNPLSLLSEGLMECQHTLFKQRGDSSLSCGSLALSSYVSMHFSNREVCLYFHVLLFPHLRLNRTHWSFISALVVLTPSTLISLSISVLVSLHPFLSFFPHEEAEVYLVARNYFLGCWKSIFLLSLPSFFLCHISTCFCRKLHGKFHSK